jgi:hypothetical protein
MFKVNILITGKTIPLQAWTVPYGSRRLRLQDFKIIGHVSCLKLIS